VRAGYGQKKEQEPERMSHRSYFFKITENPLFLQKLDDMIHTDKVKLMDSGTVLFQAGSLEEARAKVKGLLSEGELVETAPGRYTADFTDLNYFSVITAQVDEMSEAGRYAASFQEGNAARKWPVLFAVCVALAIGATFGFYLGTASAKDWIFFGVLFLILLAAGLFWTTRPSRYALARMERIKRSLAAE